MNDVFCLLSSRKFLEPVVISHVFAWPKSKLCIY